MKPATVTRAKLAPAVAGAPWRLPAARRARLDVDRACDLTARHAGLMFDGAAMLYSWCDRRAGLLFRRHHYLRAVAAGRRPVRPDVLTRLGVTLTNA